MATHRGVDSYRKFCLPGHRCRRDNILLFRPPPVTDLPMPAPISSSPRGARLLAALLLPFVLAACHHESGADLRARAEAYRRQGDQGSAVITLKNALEAEPGNAQTRYLLAAIYLETGDGTTAEKEARLALSQGYPKEPALALLAKSLSLQAEHQKALDDTGSDEDARAELLAPRADAWLALDKQERARALYEKALRVRADDAAAMIGLGRLAYLNGDPAAAYAWADRILARDPRHIDALLFRAELLRAQDKARQAFEVYDKVLALQPQHRSAHVEKAYTAIGLRRYDMAQAELNAALKLAPGSVLVAYTQALLDFSRGRMQASHDSLLKVLRVAPEHMPSVLLAGVVNLKLGSYYLAEHHFRHYLERNPGNVYASKMLATALLGSGHGQEALATLAPALNNPQSGAQKDVQLLALAGESYMRTRDFGQAAELFEKASALDPASSSLRTSLGLSQLEKGDTARALRALQAASELDRESADAAVALIRTELRLGHVDAAAQAVQALERVQPNNAVVHELKGLVAIARRDPAAARTALQRALALDPAYFAAAADLAQLALDEKRPGLARQQMLDFQAKNKASVPAMTMLASLADLDHKPDDTTRWLEQAAGVDANAVGPSVNLIAQYLRTGRVEKALNLARTLQVGHPDNPDLLDLLGKSQLASGERAEALETYRKLSFALPRSAQALMQVAALNKVLNQPAQAEETLKGVLAIQPDFPSAQVELAELYVRKGSRDLALMVAEQLQRRHPQAAAGYQLQGDIMMAKGQAAQALPLYERAFQLSPVNELAIKIDDALRQAGRRDEAAKRLDRWIAAHPDDVRTQAYKAQTWMAQSEFKRASGLLEGVLERQPGNAVALNNLALAYQELGDPRARATAEAAYKRAGEQPDVMDTLAWILLDKGSGKEDGARGLALLRKAHALAPKARDIRYHLAAALAQQGDRAAARKELEALAAGDMRFAQAGQVRELLAALSRD
jgi:putative PEP-CTERM system TPR-repeat lipoprotein